ncbi:MAG: hypothetical protein GX800_04600 [Clostridiaceae bacterium]|nr:hypothetical protein [Clostridiaceae bacterium]
MPKPSEFDVNVLPGRRLDRLKIGYDGNISFFTSAGFDLNAITINGYDQYGDDYAIYESSYEWLTGGIAAVSGAKSVGDLRLCGISSGEGTLNLKIGNVVSNGLAFTVNADLELTTLEISLADPLIMCVSNNPETFVNLPKKIRNIMASVSYDRHT